MNSEVHSSHGSDHIEAASERCIVHAKARLLMCVSPQCKYSVPLPLYIHMGPIKKKTMVVHEIHTAIRCGVHCFVNVFET